MGDGNYPSMVSRRTSVEIEFREPGPKSSEHTLFSVLEPRPNVNIFSPDHRERLACDAENLISPTQIYARGCQEATGCILSTIIERRKMLSFSFSFHFPFIN